LLRTAGTKHGLKCKDTAVRSTWNWRHQRCTHTVLWLNQVTSRTCRHWRLAVVGR
jgi:hypothetical protein